MAKSRKTRRKRGHDDTSQRCAISRLSSSRFKSTSSSMPTKDRFRNRGRDEGQRLSFQVAKTRRPKKAEDDPGSAIGDFGEVQKHSEPSSPLARFFSRWSFPWEASISDVIWKRTLDECAWSHLWDARFRKNLSFAQGCSACESRRF